MIWALYHKLLIISTANIAQTRLYQVQPIIYWFEKYEQSHLIDARDNTILITCIMNSYLDVAEWMIKTSRNNMLSRKTMLISESIVRTTSPIIIIVAFRCVKCIEQPHTQQILKWLLAMYQYYEPISITFVNSRERITSAVGTGNIDLIRLLFLYTQDDIDRSQASQSIQLLLTTEILRSRNDKLIREFVDDGHKIIDKMKINRSRKKLTFAFIIVTVFIICKWRWR